MKYGFEVDIDDTGRLKKYPKVTQQYSIPNNLAKQKDDYIVYVEGNKGFQKIKL